jgi:CheY-like chemotaxis protein
MTIDTATTLITGLRDRFTTHGAACPAGILVVDDDELVRRYVDRILREAGYRTALAADAGQAMKISWTDGPFDVLLTDLLMPGMNGDELARRLRISQPELHVLYFTGFSDRLFIDRAGLCSGEAFLDKPCKPRGLLEAVAQAAAPAGWRPNR